MPDAPRGAYFLAIACMDSNPGLHSTPTQPARVPQDTPRLQVLKHCVDQDEVRAFRCRVLIARHLVERVQNQNRAEFALVLWK